MKNGLISILVLAALFFGILALAGCKKEQVKAPYGQNISALAVYSLSSH